METLASFFSLLDRKVPISWILLGFMIFMSFKMNAMNLKIKSISKDISQIQVNLGNHIGDTNKKIDRLSNRFDRLSDRIDGFIRIDFRRQKRPV